ncbi:hypothetical protein D3C78_1647730 [compost metagenome]
MNHSVRDGLLHRKGAVKGSLLTALTLVLAAVVFVGCSDHKSTEAVNSNPAPQSEVNETENNTIPDNNAGSEGSGESPGGNPDSAVNPSNTPDKAAAADANSVAVLVNKEYALPEDQVPTD